ncbi:MAG: tetratricopeptide repeat protein [Gammaproteobacteria bacterium]|nr:tetratricopeptide repeat protein [Gammaproteobacteria bacterium]
MKTLSAVTFGAVLAFSTQAFAAGSAGGGMSASSGQAPSRSPTEIGLSHYKAGVKYKEKAWQYEEKAAKATTEKKHAKYLASAQKQYNKAIARQKKALEAVPGAYAAANELGYALRKTGEYKDAIGAYNYALQLKPDFAEAKEYKGEALIALGYFDETKDIYMDLFRTDPMQAAALMNALDAWVASHAADASSDAKAFAEWVADRKIAAQVTQVMREKNRQAW